MRKVATPPGRVKPGSGKVRRVELTSGGRSSHTARVSTRIRYDPLLVRYLAAELGERLAGKRLAALGLDPARRVAVLDFGDTALVWDLHPLRGWLWLGPAPATPEVYPFPRDVVVRAVTAPADERALVFELSASQGGVARLVVELMTNQWNLLALDADGRIRAVLWRRNAGGRALRPGAPYAPPPGVGREGVGGSIGRGAWHSLLAGVPPEERARALIERVAYTSTLNVGAILGEAATSADETALEAAYGRYAALAAFPPPSPQLLEASGLRQPYPLPLPGIPSTPYPTLLAAFAAAADASIPEAVPRPAVPPELLERLRSRIAALDARARRLGEQLANAEPEAETLRRKADLLLSQLGSVRKGMVRVELQDFEGGTVTIELDPALSPAENARRLYDAARKRQHAAERLPPLLDRVTAERERLQALLERVERGEVTAEEIEAVLGKPQAPTKKEPAAPLPYRRYRTSGGLEVWVGRSSRANDELTFRHAAPNDIWLHARDVAGAHVVLRWRDPNANPPARDLLEAAVLAALHSRARTSRAVAVDWTRRKYVRKPRKAPPGLVIPDRVKTLFVEPDEALERALRAPEA